MPTDAAEMAVAYEQLRESCARAAEEIARTLAPKGSLGLPPLLDARRIEYQIPNGVFRFHCAFDWVYVWQISRFDNDGRYGDTGIYMPTVTRSREVEQNPTGILVGAGLAALDNLRSNGIDLGHIVTFIRNSPYRVITDVIKGHPVGCLPLRDSDIQASEDLQKALASGEARIELKSFPGPNGGTVEKHVFVDKNGKQWVPTIPWLPDAD